MKHMHNVGNGIAPPRYSNSLPMEGYALQVDGRIKSLYGNAEAALQAASELKRKFPAIQVAVFDAVQGTYCAVRLISEKA